MIKTHSKDETRIAFASSLFLVIREMGRFHYHRKISRDAIVITQNLRVV
jgi:hypothetical protein